MWRQRLADYEERERDRLSAATARRQNVVEMKEQIASGQGASAERLSQAQIQAEEGKTVSQLGIDLGIPGIQETTRLVGKGVTRLGQRLAGQIDTKQMLGLKKMPDTKADKPVGEEGDVVKIDDPFATEEPQPRATEEPQPVEMATAAEDDISGESLQIPRTITQEVTPSQVDLVRLGPQEQADVAIDTGDIQARAGNIAQVTGEDIAKTATTEGAEAAAGGIGETLGGALTSVGGAIGDLAGPVGLGLGLWGAVETIKDIVKGGKAYDAAIAGAKSKIADANAQIAGLQTQVSADQFESKIGAARPSFGSLAATPTLDTSKEVAPALTF